jgi:S1-C subfamily serine protease
MNRRNFLYSLSFIFGLLIPSCQQKALSNQSQSKQLQALEINEIAWETTVRLLGDFIAASGVIIAHQGQKYLVLTCAHVIETYGQQAPFEVLTFDGKNHQAQITFQSQISNLDLALIEFKSNSYYQVATLNNNPNLPRKSRAYVSGFPNLRYHNGDWETTFDLGNQYYRFNNGRIALILPRPMARGYRLGLTNDVVQGMSGGGVFNHDGELVGIVGRSKYGLGGANAYGFADGSLPSESQLERMKSLSWAIAISDLPSFALNIL